MGSAKTGKHSGIGLAMAAVAVATAGVVIWAIVGLAGSTTPKPAGWADDIEAKPRVGSGARQRPALVDRPGTGAHTLKGTVVDAAGQPVASAAVTAELELGPGVRGAAPEPGGLDLSPVVVAISRADGGFELVGLEPGRFRLRVEGEGIVTAEVRFVDVPSPGIRLVVAREVAIAGRVVDAAGAAVADIEVKLDSDAGGPQKTARTDSAGGFEFRELAEGVYRVWAYREAEAARAARLERFGPGPFEPVTLTLEPAEVILGRTIDAETGAGISAAVTLVADDAAEPTRFGRSGADGVFRIPGVPSGRWTAQAVSPGYIPAEAVSFTSGTGYSPSLSLTRGGVLSGVVVDVDGNPVQGAVIMSRGTDASGRSREYSELTMLARAQSTQITGRALAPGTRFIPRGELGVVVGPIPFPPPRGSPALRVAVPVPADGDEAAEPIAPAHPALASQLVTDARGEFRVTGLDPGTYRVIAGHKDYADASTGDIALALAEVRSDLRLEMSPGVWVFGRVTDERGGFVPGATVTAQTPGSVLISIHTVTGLDGNYSFGPFSRSVELTASAVGYGTAEATLVIDQPPRVRQEREQNFVLRSASSTAQGRVVDGSGFPVRSATLVLDAGKAGIATRVTTTDESGRYSFGMLASGEYELSVDHPDFPKATAKVSTERAGDIRLQFGGGIELVVRDRHNRTVVAGARIRAVGPQKRAAEAVAEIDGGATLHRLVAGTWTLTASADGYVPESRDVEVPAAGRPKQITIRDVTMQLERGATLAGVVRDENGERVRGATVSAGGATGKTDENGAFRLEDVKTGAIALKAARGDLSGGQTLNVRPGDELVTLELTIR